MKNNYMCMRQVCRGLSYRLDTETLIGFLQRLGWKVSDYDEELLSALHCTDIAKGHTSFAYYDREAGLRLVFLDYRRLSAEALRLGLLHELCHIVLGHHLQRRGCDQNDLAEHEAEALAVKIRDCIAARPKRRTATAVALIIACCLGGMIYQPPAEQTSLVDDVGTVIYTEQTAQTVSKEFYITASGKRYHKADCYHIKGRDIMPISADIAVKMGYTACKDCKPDA